MPAPHGGALEERDFLWRVIGHVRDPTACSARVGFDQVKTDKDLDPMGCQAGVDLGADPPPRH